MEIAAPHYLTTTATTIINDSIVAHEADFLFRLQVSDANGFGTGGTSVAAHVGASSDDSCFDSQQDVSLAWYYSIMPENQFVQCSNTRLFWDPASVRG